MIEFHFDAAEIDPAEIDTFLLPELLKRIRPEHREGVEHRFRELAAGRRPHRTDREGEWLMVEQENRYMFEEAVLADDRHPAVKDIAQYFNFRHLPPGKIRDTSAAVAALAQHMVDTLPDCPMLTRGLDSLLSAKDAFVRAALPRGD